MAANPFDHVMDAKEFHFFESLHWHLRLPSIGGLQITKFMVLQLVAAGLILLIFIPIARRSRAGEPPRGFFWNTFEVLLTFIRERVAKPNIGAENADRYVPFLWTVFLYILFNNLLGMIPYLGSATASLSVTASLALITLIVIHGGVMVSAGVGNYFRAHILQVDAPKPIAVFVVLLFFFLELLGHLIKAFVLAVRLFANMFAGHTVLTLILLFIVMAKDAAFYLFWPITFGSVLGVTALSLLELFVAFLQAFVFTFLTSLFIGALLHHAQPHGHGETHASGQGHGTAAHPAGSQTSGH